MFLGIEVTLVDLLIGGGLGIAFFVLAAMFLRERAERGYQKDRAEMYRAQSSAQYDVAQGLRNDLKEATTRGDFWKKDYETLHTALVEVDSDLQDARANNAASLEAAKAAGEAVDFLAEKVIELVGEVGDREEDVEDLEDALEEAEAELDGADDLLDRADELLHTSTDLLQEQEQELERACALSHSATALALRLARKLDKLGVEATDEEVVGWSGAVEHQ